MVFRGRPSKACERCRLRRLKCDLKRGSCGQCVRVSVLCSGYRDTQQLRIRNESESVIWKWTSLRYPTPSVPQSLSPSLDEIARDAVFFAYYIPSSSKYWDFLKQHYHPTDAPDHLTLAIEAVSLAYLWHQLYSDTVLAAARERYVSALRITNQTLKTYKEATKDTTLLVALLLDLFEKLTGSDSQTKKSWTCHLNGALALARYRGLEHFQDPFSIRVLIRLSTNYVISCVASGLPILDEYIAIRTFVEKSLDVQDPNWRLSRLMVQYANLRSGIKSGTWSDDESVEASLALDSRCRELELDVPQTWQYSTTRLHFKSEMAFSLHYDSYPSRGVCQGRNGLRVIRVLLNEYLLENDLASSTNEKQLQSKAAAHNNIKSLAREICASVPQYIDCNSAARHRLPSSEPSQSLVQTPNCILGCSEKSTRPHSHTPQHRLDCYTLIFPLYVAGRSNAIPDMRSWVIKQCRHISSHFYIRAANVVARILESEVDVCPWEVYTMLGSYAFAA